jgi:hypothetical protein
MERKNVVFLRFFNPFFLSFFLQFIQQTQLVAKILQIENIVYYYKSFFLTQHMGLSGRIPTKLSLLSMALVFLILTAGLQPFSTAKMPIGIANASHGGLNLSDNSGNSLSPQVAISGTSVYVVWQEATSGSAGIQLKRSTDGGTNFGDVVQISNSSTSSSPKIAASGLNVYVTWHDSASDKDVFVAVSTDGGNTFSTTNLSNNTNTSINPQIAASDASVYVVWQDSGIAFRKSSNGGANFDDVMQLSSAPSASSARIAVTSGTPDILNIVWQETVVSATDIYVAVSTDGGETFAIPINVSNNTGSSSSAQISASGTSVYIVWHDNTSGITNNEVLFSSSPIGGTAFALPVNISNTTSQSLLPQITAAGTNIYVVWQENIAGNNEILFAKSTDGGLSFTSEPVNLSNNSGTSTSAQISVSSSGMNVFVAWTDNTLATANNEIFLVASIDGGATFSSTINVSNTPTSSSSPHLVAVSGANAAHVVWQELVEIGNFDVFVESNLEAEASVIIISGVSNTTPKWGIDAVSVFGTVANAESDDTVTVDWGDGSSPTTGIPLNGSSWGPVLHAYESSSISNNPHQIEAKLMSSGGLQKALTTSSQEVNVQRHSTALVVNQITSVLLGSDVEVTGLLQDVHTGLGLSGKTITIDGTGTSNLSDTSMTTGGDGTFSTVGSAPDAIGSKFSVQAHFAGDGEYESADSDVMKYDVIDPSATSFPVQAGMGITISLANSTASVDFGAIVTFEQVLEGGNVYVIECTAPESTRYIAMSDGCLDISTDALLTPGSSFRIVKSYAGLVLPSGHDADDLGIFHEVQEGTVVEITESKDSTSETVTGNTTSLSKFILGVPLHEPAPDGAIRHPLYVGVNEVSLRDITNTKNSTVNISLDKSIYQLADTATITIEDDDANRKINSIDSISVRVQSDSSAPGNITVNLLETDASSGIFEGSFGFTSGTSSTELALLQVSAGDQIQILYELSAGGRFRAVLDHVVEAGFVQLSDPIVEPGLFQTIGDAVELELVDARLSSGGLVTITMSYANALLGDNDPALLKMFQKQDATWVDITLPGPAGHDSGAKTVTGQTQIPEGQFSLGVIVGGGGGAGGGAGRIGVVLDFLVGIAPPSSGNTGGSSSSGGSSRSVNIDQQTAPTFPESYFALFPLAKIQVTGTAFVNAAGNTISQARAGQQINIASTFTNQQQVPQDYVFIILIQDENGIATDIRWQEGTAASGQTVNLSSSWMPEYAGVYTVKILVWNSLDKPLPLSGVEVNNISVG